MTRALATKPLSALCSVLCCALVFDYGTDTDTSCPNHSESHQTRLQVETLCLRLSLPIAQSPVNRLNSAGSTMFCSLGDTVPCRSFHLPAYQHLPSSLLCDLFFLFGFTSSPSPLPLPLPFPVTSTSTSLRPLYFINQSPSDPT